MESHQPPEVGPIHSDVSRLVLLHHQAIPAQQTTHRIRYTGSGQGSFNSLRHHRGAGSMSCLNGECRASHSARTKPCSKSCAGVELLKTGTESQPGEDGVNATHPHQPHQSLWRPFWSPLAGRPTAWTSSSHQGCREQCTQKKDFLLGVHLYPRPRWLFAG